jgi:hypothetical protein
LRELAGILGGGGNLLVDLTLIVEILFYVVLCLGITAQLKKQYKWHDRLQIPVVVLNLFFIGLVMMPSLVSIISSGLNKLPPLVLAHVGSGVLAQGLAVYCLLAGLKILPRKIGVLRYYMWATFILWTMTVLLGIGLYISFYTGGPDSAGRGQVEHNADLAAEHAATVVEAPATSPAEVVQEHAEPPLAEPPTDTPLEPVEEHAQESLELTQEHAEAPVASVPEPTAEPTEAPAEPVATALPANPTPDSVPGRIGLLTTSDDKVHGDKVTLALSGVTPPPAGSVYEAWLSEEGRPPLSLGKLTLTGDIINHTFTDPKGRILLGLYSGMFISVEPATDNDPTFSGVMAYQGQIAPGVLAQVRLITAANPATPNGDGLALNALNQVVGKIEPEVVFQKNYSISNNDLAALKTQAEGIINIIEGQSGANFGDLDGNGEIYDTGDGFGLLGSGDGAGYLQAIINVAAAAAQAPGATAEVKLRAEQTQTAAANTIRLLEQIRDLELQILKVTDTAAAAAPVDQVAAWYNQLKNVDSAGLTDPTKGGIRTVYNYSYLIGAIEVFAVPGQEAAPTPTLTPELIDEHAADSEHAGN